MTIELVVPPLPESVSEAVVIAWHKKAGDSIKRDENLVDLETDKVVLEVPAPQDGVITEIRIADGTTVQAGELLAIINSDVPTSAGEPKADSKTENPATSPAVRKQIKEHSLDANDITPTGKHGRITKSDVKKHVQSSARSSTKPDPEQVLPDNAYSGDRPERRVPMTQIRARIAERLVQAQNNAAMLTTFNEVDMSAVFELRGRYKEKFMQAHGVKLGLMSFFVSAATQALKDFPAVNASIEGTDIIYHGYFDIGIAVSSPRGLVVPVLRNADQMDFAQIESTIAEYAGRAQEGGLKYEELTGGTFTISNGGVFGSMLSTPILNPPQSAILGMHTIQERPIAIDGKVVVRPMMYLALTYDHRIIDGRDAVQFLVTLKKAVEDPERLLLGI